MQKSRRGDSEEEAPGQGFQAENQLQILQLRMRRCKPNPHAGARLREAPRAILSGWLLGHEHIYA